VVGAVAIDTLFRANCCLVVGFSAPFAPFSALVQWFLVFPILQRFVHLYGVG
jgi:hypothetical protein